MYAVTQGAFRTPRGVIVEMNYREDTSDWNTLTSCLTEDEYRLRELNLTGTALDIGAHIGGATIALAVDNPELHVVAVEAVPPNVVLLRENVARNGLQDRVTVLHKAAGKGKTTTVHWAFAGNETADHHAFIGNAQMPETVNTERLTETIEVVTLAQLVKEYGPIEFAKVDAEGAEYPFLQGKGLAGVAHIRGEYHYEVEPLASQLAPYFDTTFGDHAPGPFEAVRRG